MVGVQQVVVRPSEIRHGLVGGITRRLRFGADDEVFAVGLVPDRRDIDAEFLGCNEGLELGMGTVGETIANAEGEFRTRFHEW